MCGIGSDNKFRMIIQKLTLRLPSHQAHIDLRMTALCLIVLYYAIFREKKTTVGKSETSGKIKVKKVKKESGGRYLEVRKCMVGK